MEQVTDWLAKLALGQYTQYFADNDIDFSVLRFFTDQDLEKIGASLGHRRKMLAAIAELVGAAAATLQSAAASESKPRDAPSSR